MKAIALLRRPGESVGERLHVRLIADSAIVGAGRPLFLPDFAPSWKGLIGIAFRISRLGKDIAPRFARRYTDAFCLCLHLVPDGISEDDAVVGLFDNCVALGPWRMLPGDDAVEVADGDGLYRLNLNDVCADQAIAAVSRYATLKTGDIVVAAFLPGAREVRAGDDFNLEVDGEPALATRVR